MKKWFKRVVIGAVVAVLSTVGYFVAALVSDEADDEARLAGATDTSRVSIDQAASW